MVFCRVRRNTEHPCLVRWVLNGGTWLMLVASLVWTARTLVCPQKRAG